MEGNIHTSADEVFFSSEVRCLFVLGFGTGDGRVTPILLSDNWHFGKCSRLYILVKTSTWRKLPEAYVKAAPSQR